MGVGVWDFLGQSTTEYTHGFHRYPAILNPNVARRLINRYGAEAEHLLDPFCGSGTTLVEARLAGISATGFDVNPTARLIALAKSQNYDIRRLRSFVTRLDSVLDSLVLTHWQTAVKRSGFSRDVIRTWYPNRTIREIASIMELIDVVDAKDGRNRKHRLFARVALSDCLREVSIQRMGEWKNYRIENWRNRDIDELYKELIPLFKGKLRSNFDSACSYISRLNTELNYQNTEIIVNPVNCVNTGEFPSMPEEGYDLVVTSPPYGDSSTTVAYEQFSWQTNVWLGFDRRPSGQLAKDMMGGILASDVERIGCKAIDSAIGKMQPKFAKLNYSFYKDYLSSVENIAKAVTIGGHVCYVVGNRTSGGQKLRLDLFTKWAFEQNGFEAVGKIKQRKIPNSKMPSIIAVTGKKVEKVIIPTITDEYIVVCKRTT